jgi:phosphoserine phosphatase RsbU/P
MKDTLLLSGPETIRKPYWKRWKWIGLALFAGTLLLKTWLPDWIVAIGGIYGTIVLLNLGFHLARRLKDRFFWRVRNRVVGSFIFVGLIPLLLIAGVVYLSGYALLGQLASHYLTESMDDLEEEILRISVQMAQLLPLEPGAQAFETSTQRVIAENSKRFPRMAVLWIQPSTDGGYEIKQRVDPLRILPALERLPVGKWLAGKQFFHDLVVQDRTAWFISIQTLPRWSSSALALMVPLDGNIQSLMEKDKSVYAEFVAVGKTKVTKTRTSISVEFENQDHLATEEELRPHLESLNTRAKNESQRMISWGALVDGFDLTTGNRGIISFALFRVPIAALYQTYLVGTEEAGKVLFTLIPILLGLLAVAELISFMIGFTINRRITQSVNDIYQGTMALQKGELQHRIPVRRHDQLGLLAHSFNQMSGSITRLLEEVSEKKRLEQELEIAREVQASLFPKQLPHAPGVAVFGGCEPARVVSGDYYDFIFMDDTRLHIIVGDISGKGISAALLMANLQAAIRNQLMALKEPASNNPETSLASLMEQLNQQIFENSPSEKYATLFALRYDAGTCRLAYCNAGHLPPYLLLNGSVKRLEAGGTVLGLFSDTAYTAASVELPAGATLAIFTDGVTEAVNENDEEFGEDRLLEALRESRAATPEGIYHHVINRVQRWQGNMKQQDDITLIIAKTHYFLPT